MSTTETDKNAWEQNRRCMLKIYASHIQTHAAILIATIIGGFTLISRFDAFYPDRNNVLTFGLLLSALIASSLYIVCRIFYWSFYDNATAVVRYSEIKKIKENNMKEGEPIPDTYALPLFIKDYLKNPTSFYPDAKMELHQKIAAISSKVQLMAAGGVFLLSFVIFLFVNGYLWHF